MIRTMRRKERLPIADINSYILQFVNSKDIRKHLGEIGYTFSALEAAWLIWQNQKVTLKEKHRAWNRVIREYPDCPIERRSNTEPQESLHGFLQEYMGVENWLLDRFHDPTGAVYLTIITFTDGISDCFPRRIASRFDPGDEVYMLEEDEKYATCWRQEVDSPKNRGISVKLNRKRKIMEVDIDSLEDDEHRCEIFRDVLPGLWFDFPTPFKKGDILWNPVHPGGLNGGPLVLLAVNLDRLKGKEKIIANVRRNGDFTDMDLEGIFVGDKLNLYEDTCWGYMDMEYYPKEPEGAYRLLLPASAYVKGEIDLCLFARACKTITLEVETERMFPNEYTREGLELAGIKIVEKMNNKKCRTLLRGEKRV